MRVHVAVCDAVCVAGCVTVRAQVRVAVFRLLRIKSCRCALFCCVLVIFAQTLKWGSDKRAFTPLLDGVAD